MGSVHPRTLFAYQLEFAAPVSKRPIYLYKNCKSGNLILFQHAKNVREKGFAPLTSRDITVFGYRYKKELLQSPEEAYFVCTALTGTISSILTKENKQNIWKRAGLRIWDYGRNFFSGYGLHTSVQLARKLRDELALQAVGPKGEIFTVHPDQPSRPIFVPSKTSALSHQRKEEPKEIPATPPRISPPKKKSRFWFTPYAVGKVDTFKAAHIKNYKETVLKGKKYSRTFTIELFNNINYARPDEDKDTKKHILNKNNLTVFVYLLMYITGSDEPDLKDKVVRQLIVDTFRMGNEHLLGSIADWLITEPDCDVELLRDCFDACCDKFAVRDDNPFYPSSLLMELYLDRLEENPANAKRVPLDSPEVVRLMTRLLTNFHYENGITGLTQRIAKRKDLTLDTFTKLLEVFHTKERTKSTGRPMLYVPRDVLLNAFKDRPEWHREAYKINPRLRDYLQGHGALKK